MVSFRIWRGHALRIAVGFLMLALYLTWGASAATLTVNASGGGMFTTIQEAINHSSNGDTILVYSGTYYENVDISKQVVLRGVDDGSGLPVKVIAGGDSENAIILSAGNSILEGFTAYGVGYGTGIIVRSDNNIIRNNTATNYYLGYNNVNGIIIWASTNNTLINNKMTGNKQNFGQYMVSSGNHNIDTSNLVDGKPIYYLRNAVNSVYDNSTNAGTFYCIDCVNVTVEDVNLNNNYVGIVFWNTTGSTIRNIRTSNNGNGISLYASSNNTLSANTNSGNDGVGFFIDSSGYNNLSGNIANFGHGGIHMNSSNHNILSGNNVSNNNNWGIILDSSNNNVLSSNNISDNDDGLVMSYSANNRIYNNFFNNTYANVAFLSYGNYWNTTKTPGTNIIGGLYLGGNVWSNPGGTGFSQTCTDNDEDGICDSSYTLASNNIDYLPLANKSNISDTTPPVLTFTVQTPANGLTLNQKWAVIETNANEPLKTALLEWNGVNESMSGSGTSWNKRKISLANGTYTFRVWGSDNFGNWNSTEERVITVAAPPTDRTIGGGTGNGSIASGPMTWTASNFPAFWHEDGISGETLSVNQNDLSETQRAINQGNLVYSTSKRVIPYKVYTETGLGVNYGSDSSYAKVGWLGKPYVAVNGQAYKLSQIILEQNSMDFKNLAMNESWDLGNGYSLKLQAIDINIPRQALLILSNKTDEVPMTVKKEGEALTYLTNLAGESDVPFFVTFIDNVSDNSVRLKYTWLISDNVTIFNSADMFGNMEVRSANTDGFYLSNENTMTLSKGSTVNLIDDFDLIVNDKSSLEYYPSLGGLDQTPPSSLSISINNGNKYSNSTLVTLNISAANATQMAFSNNNSNWSEWETYAATKSWTLTDGDGQKTVYFKAKNIAGEAIPINDTIILDTTKPAVTNLTTATSTPLINQSVNISVTVMDNTSLSKVNISITYPSKKTETFQMNNNSSVTYLNSVIILADPAPGPGAGSGSGSGGGGAGGEFYFNFNNTTEYGRYDVTIIAGDLVGNINDTAKTWFVTSKTSGMHKLLNGGKGETANGSWMWNSTNFLDFLHNETLKTSVLDGSIPVGGLSYEISREFDVKNLSVGSKNMTTGETWDLGKGYSVKIEAIQSNTTPRTVWLNLSKNGKQIDENVSTEGELYLYDSNYPEEQLFIIADDIFQDSIIVHLSAGWVSSDKIVKIGDRFDNLTVKDESWNGLIQYLNLTNNASINLTMGSSMKIMNDLYFKVENSTNLGYYPYFNRAKMANTIDIPEGNLSLDISVNDSLSIDVNVTERTDLTPDMNSSFLGLKSMHKFVEINVTDDLKNHLEWVIVKIYYTQAELDASGLDESSLKLSWYNETADTWELVPQQGIDATHTGIYAGHVWANLSHFSTFALLGSSPVPARQDNSGGSSSSSSGGGGGGSSGENYTNIEVSEKYDIPIYKDKVTSYRFTNAKNPIMYVNITGNVSTEAITAMVEVLKDTSTLVTSAPPGIAYKNANIWIGKKGFAIPMNIQKGIITFRVETSWINTNNLASSDIKLQRWDGTGWVTLETIQKNEDGKYTYFETSTNYFSPFAITGMKASTPVQTKEAISASTPAAGTPVETKSQTNRSPAIGVIFVIGIVIVLYLMKKGKSG